MKTEHCGWFSPWCKVLAEVEEHDRADVDENCFAGESGDSGSNCYIGEYGVIGFNWGAEVVSGSSTNPKGSGLSINPRRKGAEKNGEWIQWITEGESGGSCVDSRA